MTVIIPSNRSSPFLHEAVASARAQTHPVASLVLVDDGSPYPGLSAIADELDLIYVRQQAAGISAARNRGVQAAATDWIAFLDDDDVWHPDRLARQMAMLDSASSAVACATGGWYMRADGSRFGSDWVAIPATRAELLRGDSPFPRVTTLTMKRSAYLSVGGCDTTMEPAEDNDLIMRLLLAGGEITTVPAPLVGYRRHDANVTTRSIRGRVAGDRVVRRNLARALRSHDAVSAELLRANLRRFRSDHALDNLRELAAALRSGRLSDARDAFTWAVFRAPRASARACLSGGT
ncbi:glycosyltransferase family 2 protein [Microbacterium marinum]|uniref:glycosyltransferase family 2 protein n=1 Tax=Microbacterium marinum TaxID=421115 RepID=UPI00384A8271